MADPCAPVFGLLEARTEILTHALYRYARVGHDERQMMFLLDGQIGKGRAGLERGWQLLADETGAARLQIVGDAGVICELERGEDHCWRGRWRILERMEITLTPLIPAAGTYLRASFLRFLSSRNIRTIVELGSGIGYEAIALNTYWEAPVYTFECHEKHVAFCRYNLQNHPDIMLVEKAAWNQTGPLIFYETESNTFASSLFHPNEAYPYESFTAKTVEIPGVRLDEWAADQGIEQIDLLCLDIQGACYQALEGLGAYLPRVKYIIAEIETLPIYQGEKLYPEVFALLAEAGFRPWLSCNNWGCLPDGRWLGEVPYPPQYHWLPSWFGDFLFVHFDEAESAVYDQLCQQRFFRYVRLGYDERVIELLPNGEIDMGRGGCECNWLVENDGKGNVALTFYSQTMKTACLDRDGEKAWAGRWLVFECMDIRLEPCPIPPNAPQARMAMGW